MKLIQKKNYFWHQNKNNGKKKSISTTIIPCWQKFFSSQKVNIVVVICTRLNTWKGKKWANKGSILRHINNVQDT